MSTTINFAKYARPELVLADLREAAGTLANTLFETMPREVGDEICSDPEAVDHALRELAPRVAALAALYLEATTPDGSPF